MVENKALRGFYIQVNDKVVSVQLIAVHNKKAYALFVGTDDKAYKLYASNFIYFNIIKQLKCEDYEYFNISGIAKDSSYSNMFFAKTSLGAQKRWCWYDMTKNLHGFLPNF
jgi:lipid II:glycine glycyltransferase (peptidoglycan interpeptide bridge formation enzyme)